MSVQGRTTLRLLDKADKQIRKLPQNVKGALYDFQYKFRENPKLTGLRFKALEGHDRLYSARVNADYRALLFHVGDSDYILVGVRHRNHVYDHLDRFRYEVNAVTGALEIFGIVESREVTEEAPPAHPAVPEPAPAPAAEEVPAPGSEPEESSGADESGVGKAAAPLFADHTAEQLRELGVAEGLIDDALAVTSDSQLLELVYGAPGHTEDVLLALADGKGFDQVMAEITGPVAAEEPVDTTDYPAALARTSTRVTTSDTDLREVLDDDFAAWKVFLHPAQEKLVRRHYRGPARVTGGPGTGKTIVALHRVKHLVEQLPPGRSKAVLLTTYNTNLAADLRRRLLDLAGQEVADRVDIVNIDRLVSRIVTESGQGGRGRTPINDNQVLREWRSMLTEVGEQRWSAEFLNDEWNQVILGQSLRSRGEYFRARRAGRGQRISRAQRAEIWQLVERFTMRLEERGVWSYRQIAEAAAQVEGDRAAKIETNRRREAQGGPMLHHRDQSSMNLRFRYRHIVVDEAQDLSSAHWTLLRAMVDRTDNDIFLVGDTHQRIYDNRVSLGALGIEIRGRSARLTLSYRTTREILGSALGLLGDETWDDLDEGTDTLDGYRSVLRGPRPGFSGSPTWAAERDALAAWAQEQVERDGRAASVAIAVPTGNEVNEVQQALVRAGVRAAALGKDGPPPGYEEAVHVGTLHRFKGLEYQHMAIGAVSEGLVPRTGLERLRANDAPRYRLETQKTRSLLFVAATRARDSLLVSWHGDPSPLLPKKAVRAAEAEGDGFEDGGLFKPPGALL
ncbi:DNA helicase [Nocardiopsis sp. TSRI0078]|uniref:UvrD-helicase domain-containing protein n=1 Tax=unclassified Nocardiopsis TaxID=2649073 RepID=UPI00093DE51A|nr:UvrD-helicase domain-containing protein [Nocardiopsis sp. TSRI0078]OKI17011.1 DNA helicase [Nocardiopsis sp. TSRI0078]